MVGSSFDLIAATTIRGQNHRTHLDNVINLLQYDDPFEKFLVPLLPACI